MAFMSVSIHEVLETLRGTALDERDKGDKFERLVLICCARSQSG
jgi:hypothetical protein